MECQDYRGMISLIDHCTGPEVFFKDVLKGPGTVAKWLKSLPSMHQDPI